MNADFWCLGGWGAGELVVLGISRLRFGRTCFGKRGSGRGYSLMNADFWCLEGEMFGRMGCGWAGGSRDFSPAARNDMFWGV